MVSFERQKFEPYSNDLIPNSLTEDLLVDMPSQ